MAAHLPPDEVARRADVQLRHVPREEEQPTLRPRHLRRRVVVARRARHPDEPPRLREDKGREDVIVGGVVVGELDHPLSTA